MISNRVIFLMFGVIFFAGGVWCKHPPALFTSRFETPDDFDIDEASFNERKYQELQRAYQANWPWAKAFDNGLINDHQAAKPNSKNGGDEGNVSDFVEYSTEHLPIPQRLIQNYIKGKTAKKNSNQFSTATCKFYFVFSQFIFFYNLRYFSCNMGRKRNTRYLHLNDIMETPWRP